MESDTEESKEEIPTPYLVVCLPRDHLGCFSQRVGLLLLRRFDGKACIPARTCVRRGVRSEISAGHASING